MVFSGTEAPPTFCLKPVLWGAANQEKVDQNSSFQLVNESEVLRQDVVSDNKENL